MNVYFKATLVTLVSAVVLLGAFDYWRQKSNPVTDRPSLSLLNQMETQGVPGFKLKTLDDKDFELSELQGQVVIVNFWASWCGPCLEEFPSMIELIRSMDNQVKLVAIAQDANKEEIIAFLKAFPEYENQSSVTIVWDKDHEAAKAYAVDRLPETFVLRKDHKLARKITGSINWNSPDAIAFMKNLLTGL